MSFHEDAVKCKTECCVVNIHNASYFSPATPKEEKKKKRRLRRVDEDVSGAISCEKIVCLL